MTLSDFCSHALTASLFVREYNCAEVDKHATARSLHGRCPIADLLVHVAMMLC